MSNRHADVDDDLARRQTVSWIDPGGELEEKKVGPSCLEVRLEDARRIRKPPKYRQQRNYHGFYWCAGSASHVWYESMTEYTALMLLDHTEQLVAVTAQPCCLRFPKDKRHPKGRRHFPDFFAVHADGTRHLYDVRPESLIDERAREQFESTAEVCAAIGWGYEVLHGVTGTRRHNLEWLAAYRQPWNAPGAEARDYALAELEEPRALRDLAVLLDVREPARYVHWIYHLMWTRQVVFDSSTPLHWGTELRRNNG